MKEILAEADVVVLGAGAAGCLASYAARKRDAKVLLVDKGALVSCGCTGAGQDHFAAHLNTGPDWDSDAIATKWYSLPGWGAGPTLVERTFTKVVGPMVKLMEEWGIEFYRNNDGSYWRCQALGQPGPWWLMMKNGRYLKRIFANKVLESGVDVVEQLMITRLLKDKNKVIGALGFNRRNGEFYVLKAKAVVLAMGAHQSRWYTNSTNNPFNIWQNPSNTGTQIVVAYEVGAKVKNLEWCVETTLPKGFGAPAMCGFSGMGSFMRNCLGEKFMDKYHELGEKAPRAFHMRAEVEETTQGRTPLFVDSTHLSEGDLRHLHDNLLSVDKHTFGDYLEQRGIDIKEEPLEVEKGEFSGGGNLHVNENCESVNMRGLFGLPFSGMLSTAVCGGYFAGTAAAECAAGFSGSLNVDSEQIFIEKQGIVRRFEREEGYSPREFEGFIRQIMMHYMGHKRSLKGLELASKSLNLLESKTDEIKASKNFHQLTRCYEALHLLKYCQLMIRAVRERKGMRGFYNLVDYPPNLDPDLKFKYLVLFQENGNPKVAFEPVETDRGSQNAA
jgi:adenylylsulfate reductase subunit A